MKENKKDTNCEKEYENQIDRKKKKQVEEYKTVMKNLKKSRSKMKKTTASWLIDNNR